MINYRLLTFSELHRIWEIDRSEYIASVYRYEDGELRLEPLDIQVDGWPQEDLNLLKKRLADSYLRGGLFYSAFDKEKIVGIGVLDPKWFRGAKDTLDLSFLYVDAAYRGRGIAKTIFLWIAGRAKNIGATSLYVSASDSKNTVDFYLAMACEISKAPIPELFELEPKDIHLDFDLSKIT